MRRLGNRILNFIYTARPIDTSSAASTDMVESILGFEQQASDWLRSLPRRLGLHDTSPVLTQDDNLHTTLKFILSGHLLDCYEMMYWPFIAEAVNTTSDSTPPVARDFASKALNTCFERIQKNEPGFFYRHHGTWLMLRSCTRSALVLIAASRSTRMRRLLPEGWHTAVGKVVEMLRFWRRESRDVEDRLGLVEKMWRPT